MRKIVIFMTTLTFLLMMVAFLLHGYHPVLAMFVAMADVIIAFTTRRIDLTNEVGIWE